MAEVGAGGYTPQLDEEWGDKQIPVDATKQGAVPCTVAAGHKYGYVVFNETDKPTTVHIDLTLSWGAR